VTSEGTSLSPVLARAIAVGYFVAAGFNAAAPVSADSQRVY